MAPARRRFGPLFYVTLGVSCLILLVVYGRLRVWPRVEALWKVWTLEREWRDSSLSRATREAAAARLVEFGSTAVSSFLEVGNDPDDPLRSTAYAYLSRITPPVRDAIADCLKALKTDGDPQVRLAAADLLGLVAIPGGAETEAQRQEIIASLEAAGKDSAPLVRASVMHALVFAKDTKPDLTAWLKDDNRDVRLAAAEAILQIDLTNKDRVVMAIRTMVVDGNNSTKEYMWLSRDVLRNDPEGYSDLVPTFVSWLRDVDPGIRTRVAGLLGSLGTRAREALPVLETRFERGQPGERIAMAWAIVSIDPAAVNRVTHAIKLLIADPAVDRKTRAEAARLIRGRDFMGSMGSGARASAKSSPETD